MVEAIVVRFLFTQKMIGTQNLKSCPFHHYLIKYQVMELFKVIRPLILATIFLVSNNLYSQEQQSNELFLQEGDFELVYEQNDSIIIQIHQNSILYLIKETGNLILNLSGSKGTRIIAGKMGLFDAAFPPDCNYYYLLISFIDDYCRIVLRSIPIEYQWSRMSNCLQSLFPMMYGNGQENNDSLTAVKEQMNVLQNVDNLLLDSLPSALFCQGHY